MDQALLERLQIRELIENWAIWRDAGDWERLRTVWHDDGVMMATWTQGTAAEYIQASIDGWQRGAEIAHLLGGTCVDLAGTRATAQTRMTILQRIDVHGALCDIECTGRFFDFFEKRSGKWGLVLRQPIYEKDRIDPVDPNATLDLDHALLERFPIGYRHLAYVQSLNGYPVKTDMPGLKGPAVEALYTRGLDWLSGAR